MPYKPHEVCLCDILLQNHCVFLLSLALPCERMSQAGPCRPPLAPSCCVASTARLASPHALPLLGRTSGIHPLSTTPSVPSGPSVSITSPPGMRTAMMPRVSGTTPWLRSAWSGSPWSPRRTWRVPPPFRVLHTASTARTSTALPMPWSIISAPAPPSRPPPWCSTSSMLMTRPMASTNARSLTTTPGVIALCRSAFARGPPTPW
jgi:hypothetical protein